MFKFPPIKLDRSLNYSSNIANALNAYWGDTVAVPDGMNAFNCGDAIMPSRYGIPDRIRARWPRKTHHAIIRMRRIEGTNRWMIVDAEQEDNSRRQVISQYAGAQRDTRKAA